MVVAAASLSLATMSAACKDEDTNSTPDGGTSVDLGTHDAAPQTPDAATSEEDGSVVIVPDGSIPDGSTPIACNTICTVPSDPCRAGFIDCSGSTPTCRIAFNLVGGTACGDTGELCDNFGTCVDAPVAIIEPTDSVIGIAEHIETPTPDESGYTYGHAGVFSIRMSHAGSAERHQTFTISTSDDSLCHVAEAEREFDITEDDTTRHTFFVDVADDSTLSGGRDCTVTITTEDGAVTRNVRVLDTDVLAVTPEGLTLATDWDDNAFDISNDGIVVATATPFAEDDTSGENDIYYLTRSDSGFNKTLLSRRASTPPAPTGYSSFSPRINNDGWVVFNSSLPNLVDDDTEGQMDIFLTNVATPGTLRRLVQGTMSCGANYTSLIAKDAPFVVFQTCISHDARDMGEDTDTYLYDIEHDTYELLTINSSDQRLNSETKAVGISDDGRYVMFITDATNATHSVVTPACSFCGSETSMIIRDRTTNSFWALPLQNTGGYDWHMEPYDSIYGAPTTDGKVLAGLAGARVLDDTNGRNDIYLVNSFSTTGSQPFLRGVPGFSSPFGTLMDSGRAEFLNNGAYATFLTYDPSFINSHISGPRSSSATYVIQTATKMTRDVGVHQPGRRPTAPVMNVRVSADGGYILFASWANDIVDDVNDGNLHLYLTGGF